MSETSQTPDDSQDKLVVFGGNHIRRAWVDDQWYFSVVDIIGALTDSTAPAKYWDAMKRRELSATGIQLSTICRQLKLTSVDGKSYKTDAVNTEAAFRIIQSIPNPKAEPFKRWLAQVGYLFAAAVAMDSGAAEKWVGERVIELIEMGGPRFIDHLGNIGPPDSTAATLEAWKKLLNYLGDNHDSLWYGQRLKEGLPIGSGLIEGGGKNTLARRLKINSARWRVRRAERMGAIRCLQYSGLWEPYWDAKRAA